MSKELHYLFKLHSLKGLTITAEESGFIYKYEDIIFNGTYLSIEEGLAEATVFILARIEAKRLIKEKAKVVLGE